MTNKEICPRKTIKINLDYMDYIEKGSSCELIGTLQILFSILIGIGVGILMRLEKFL